MLNTTGAQRAAAAAQSVSEILHRFGHTLLADSREHRSPTAQWLIEDGNTI
jgi:hypothetical protein